ncbi:glycosyltransferase [Endozoicomonas sp. OPT23]|uniref:glycosyltransferase n=1 Tax=Endozoicomonas sp. OPT23 TaxID=2072845 RepID=UPI001890E340|nr:glycosyltransferase [Endozoicomonas sp. OPT23]
MTARLEQLNSQYRFKQPLIFYTQPELPYLSQLTVSTKSIYFHSWHRHKKSSSLASASNLATKCKLTFSDISDVYAKELSTIVFTSGIDYPSFSTPQKHPGNFKNTQPVAGYFGEFTQRLNIELLAQAATALPNWQFLFVGRIKCKKGVLEELPNVEFLGEKSDSCAAGYLQNWDVSLFPVATDAIEPDDLILLQEYMASGTPVAAVQKDYPDSYHQCICIQGNKEPFSQTLQRALSDTSRKDIRQEIARLESYQNKAAQLNKLIHHLTADQPLNSQQESLF